MVAPPSRRETLQLFGSVSVAGLAGCITQGLSGFQAETTQSSERSTLGEPGRNFSFSVEVLQSFTPDHPGRISISLQNDYDDPLAMGIYHGVEGPMSSTTGNDTDGEGELVILAAPPQEGHETPPGAPCESDEYAIPSSRPDGCWQPACDFASIHHHYAIRLPAKSTLSWPYVVLDGFNKTCLPPGTYVFEETTPIAILKQGETIETTPSDGWKQLIRKELKLSLEADGSLSADANLEILS